MDSVVTELLNEGFHFERVDLRYQASKAMKYRVRRNPTFIYVRDGHEVRRMSGYPSKNSLRRIFREPLW